MSIDRQSLQLRTFDLRSHTIGYRVWGSVPDADVTYTARWGQRVTSAVPLPWSHVEQMWEGRLACVSAIHMGHHRLCDDLLVAEVFVDDVLLCEVRRRDRIVRAAAWVRLGTDEWEIQEDESLVSKW